MTRAAAAQGARAAAEALGLTSRYLCAAVVAAPASLACRDHRLPEALGAQTFARRHADCAALACVPASRKGLVCPGRLASCELEFLVDVEKGVSADARQGGAK